MFRKNFLRTLFVTATVATLVCGMVTGCGKTKEEVAVQNQLGLSDKEYNDLKNEVMAELSKETKSATEASKKEEEEVITSFGYPYNEELKELSKNEIKRYVQIGDIIIDNEKRGKTVGDFFALLEGSELEWDTSVLDKTFNPWNPDSGADIVGRVQYDQHENPEISGGHKITPVLFVPSKDGKYMLYIWTNLEDSIAMRYFSKEDSSSTYNFVNKDMCLNSADMTLPVRDLNLCYVGVVVNDVTTDNFFWHHEKHHTLKEDTCLDYFCIDNNFDDRGSANWVILDDVKEYINK